MKRCPAKVSTEVNLRIERARQYDRASETESAWRQLEEAHILSQPWPAPHTKVHLHMFVMGFRHRSWSEVRGQSLRLLLAGLGSASGRIPVGNTGRAHVSAFAPMAIPPDLEELIRRLA